VILLALAAALAAAPDDEERGEPGFTLAVGQRAAAAVGTVMAHGPSLDTTTHLSFEAPLDDRTSLRFEAGWWADRSRVHLAGVARGYPAGRRPLTGFLEVGGHLQLAGPRYRPEAWAPEPARGWVSAPLFFGGGGRATLAEHLVVEATVAVGTLVELRPRDRFSLSLGVGVTAAAQVGWRF
jgi:hypothetical protein